MNIITAIENKKINEELKHVKNIKILNSDIQYKEGILEYLEKNKKVEIIILKNNLPGQIKISDLIKEIQKINNKIKIIIFDNKKDKEKNKNTKNVKYIYLEKITINHILKILNIKNNIEKTKERSNIIKVTGNRGSGKTIFIIIFSKVLLEIKNKRILLIDEGELKILTKIYLRNKFGNNISKIKEELKYSEKIKIENEIYLLNINYLINKKTDILEYINKIKKEFDYIIIDSKNNNGNKYEKIINKKLYLLELNVLELEKAKEYLRKNKTNIIINKKNLNSINKEIFKKTFKQKILGEINNSKNINLFINNNFNLDYLCKREKDNFLNIIEKLERN